MTLTEAYPPVHAQCLDCASAEYGRMQLATCSLQGEAPFIREGGAPGAGRALLRGPPSPPPAVQ